MNSCSCFGRTRRTSESPAVLDRTTRQIVTDGGQIVKVGPWGRRRLAYPIDRYREGSYHIVLFEAPPERDRGARAHPADHRGGPSPPRRPRGSPGPSAARRTARRRVRSSPAPDDEDEEPDDGTRADRRIRERSGPGRHRLRRPGRWRSASCMIIGNLGRDPEMRYTPNGRPVTEFSVAVNQDHARTSRPASGSRRPTGSGSASGATAPSARRSSSARAAGSSSTGASGPASTRRRTAEAALARDHGGQRDPPRPARREEGTFAGAPGAPGGAPAQAAPARCPPADSTTPRSTNCPSDLH